MVCVYPVGTGNLKPSRKTNASRSWKIRFKAAVKAGDGLNYAATFVVYQISLIWEYLFDSKQERLAAKIVYDPSMF